MTAARPEPVARATPHLSFSRLSRYLHCPEQYRLYYVENLRPKVPPATLVFGQIVHQALARLFQSGEDPVSLFGETWEATKQVALTYGTRDSWERLDGIGEVLLARFVADELPKLGTVGAVEKPFQLDVTSLDLPLVGVVDLVAVLDGKRTVIDFKTASARYDEHEAELSDQLTAYQLAEPTAEQAALCVLVKTKEPRIEWHLTSRTERHLSEFLTKAALLGRRIAEGEFYKRPGLWCAWCDYLPVCTGDTVRAAETLVRVR
ncbi:MAG: PD-(D/E)XK nuclease family protein [Acidobacteria bacterium]|nr:PD-(D/E)XK nuclease family protein [Acidobacteriota bacterium]